MTDDEDDGTITAADLAEAQSRWADPSHEPAAPELFAHPVYGDRLRGDVTIADALAELAGTDCTAKRYGWDATPDEEDDRDPREYATDDLAGELEIVGDGPVKAYLVGGQEADPKTIRPA